MSPLTPLYPPHPIPSTPSTLLPPPTPCTLPLSPLPPCTLPPPPPPPSSPSHPLYPGYGLLNYRATQAFGSETLYGSYFAAGDTVGVLLDMDHGTLSFFKDGEDFNLGTSKPIL